MPYITISEGLTIKQPTRSTTGWGATMLSDTFTPISSHDHTGSGSGTQLTEASLASGAVTGTKIRLDNDQNLRGRNNADSADINIIKVNTSDTLTFGANIASLTALDNGFTIVDNSDTTKAIAFEASGITTATTRTLTVPDASGTLTLLAATQTLTNKTIALGSNTVSTTASRAIESDGSGNLTASSVTSTELGYVSGVTSAIQTQLDTKIPTAGGTISNLLMTNNSALHLGELDANGTEYTGFVAPTSLSSNLLYTLPNGDGAASEYLSTDGSLTLSWTTPGSSTSVTSKTTTYTITTSDDIVECSDASGSFTVTLYTASGNTGKEVIIKKTNSSSNKITIDGDGSETIDGQTSVYLHGQYEYYWLYSDGTNWKIKSHNPQYTVVGPYFTNGAAGDGAATTADTFVTREVDTVLAGIDSMVSISTNQVTLDPGTYNFKLYAISNDTTSGASVFRIRNTSDSTTVVDSVAGETWSDNSVFQTFGSTTITSSKVFEVQHCMAASSGDGQGRYGTSFTGYEAHTFMYLVIEKVL